MPRQQRVLSHVGSIVLAVLVLVPLALRGHHHGSHDPAARPCAACVVAQHSAAVDAPPLGLDTPAFRAFSLPRTRPRVVARPGASPAHGRAPPHDPSRAA